jgi:hypothetical protein
MTGDLGAADTFFQKYVGLVRNSQAARADSQLAEWEFFTGRRKAAVSRLEQTIPSLDPDGQSLAMSQLSLWKLELGDPKAAAELADQAGARAVTVRAKSLSAVSRFISAPQPASSGSRLVDALALLFARKYREATPLLETLYRETNPAEDGQIRTLLAWAYMKTGQAAEAGPLVQTYPIPLSTGERIFAPLVFPRYLFVRAAVLAREGKKTEAKKGYDLFRKFAGDVPDIFGDQPDAGGS